MSIERAKKDKVAHIKAGRGLADWHAALKQLKIEDTATASVCMQQALCCKLQEL